MNPAETNTDKQEFAAVPKKIRPFSLQSRFVLMQAVSMVLALWLIAAAVYVNQKIRSDLSQSLKELQAHLALNAEVQSAMQSLVVSFWKTYYSPNNGARSEYDVSVRQLTELIDRYSREPLHADEWIQTRRLQQAERELVRRTGDLLTAERPALELTPEIREVQELTARAQAALHDLSETELAELQTSREKLRWYTQGLYAVLLGCAAFALLAMSSFRRVHQRQLWEPLDELRRMVLEMRRGNLNVSAAIPQGAELGSLVRAFLEMAARLREMRDSLEQKVLARTAELEAAQSQLLQAAKLSALGQLVSGVAHEINNPLTSVLGFSEVLLSRRDLSPSLRGPAETIRAEALRLKNLVANLNSFARRGLCRTTQLDLRVVLDRLVELRRYQLASSGIQLQHSAPSEPIWVQGDPDQLLQVFFNLVLNAEQAIQARREKGQIRLSCGHGDGSAWATVDDNGAGISPAALEKIFDPFFTTKPVGKGTGLGLSISHGIVQQHKGEIRVESVEGQGTRVTVLLPLAPSESPAVLKETLEAAPAPPPTPHVLVIDDEPSITDMMEHALLKLGYRATLLNDPLGVEKALDQADFDLVICDIKMPQRSGLEILRQLRQSQPNLLRRFLLMTGNLADAEESVAELKGIPILHKPFTLSQLSEAVRPFLPQEKENERR